jgi:hypothetical protein
VSVQAINITFDRERERPDDESPLAINREDCEANVLIRFPVTIRAATRDMEVWVGTEDCGVAEVRRDGGCVRAWSGYVNSQTTEIAIPTHDLLFGVNNEGACGDLNAREAVTTTAHFSFLVNGDPSEVAGESATVEISYDLQGPPPPEITGLNAGEGKVIVKWTDSSSSGNPVGYRLFCDPGTVVEGSAGAAGASGESCASGLADEQIPDASLQCGEIAGQSATRATAKDLSNETSYAVGIAAVDSVGNVGPLALGASCVTPREVTDFYEAYVASGGKGGGGFCSFGVKRPGSLAGLVFVALVGFVSRRRLAS